MAEDMHWFMSIFMTKVQCEFENVRGAHSTSSDWMVSAPIAPIRRHKLMVLSTERKLMMTKARVKRKCEHRFSIMDIEHRTSDLLFVLFSLMLFHVFISLFFFLRSFFLPDWNSIRLLIHVQHNVTNDSTLNLQVDATCASLSFALALALALFGLYVLVYRYVFYF